MARPPTYNDSDVVSIASAEARSKLQENSQRRAIINTIVDNGGKMSLSALDESFGYDVRQQVLALVNVGWLELNT